MLTKSDVTNLMTSGLRTEFNQKYASAKTTTIYQDVAMRIDSNKSEEIYNWLGATPKMREWRDERAPKGLLEHGFRLINKDFEATMSVHRNAVEDDQYGQIKIRARQLAVEAKRFFDEYMTSVLELGTTELGYDGQYFFDTDHSEGVSGSQSNNFVGTDYDITSAADAAAAMQIVYTAMTTRVDDSGKKNPITPTHVMVPSNLFFHFRNALDPAVLARAGAVTLAEASMAGLLQLIVNPYLSTTAGANAPWFMMDLSQEIKPLVFQMRKEPEFVAKDDPKDEDNFWRKEMYYGVDWRGNFGYGDWMLIARAAGA